LLLNDPWEIAFDMETRNAGGNGQGTKISVGENWHFRQLLASSQTTGSFQVTRLTEG